MALYYLISKLENIIKFQRIAKNSSKLNHCVARKKAIHVWNCKRVSKLQPQYSTSHAWLVEKASVLEQALMREIATAHIWVYLVAPFSRDTRKTCLTLHSDRKKFHYFKNDQHNVLKTPPHQTRPLPFVQGHLGNQALPEGCEASTLGKQKERKEKQWE